MDNNLEGSTLTIDLNSEPIQNPNEALNSKIEGICDMRSLSNEHQGDEHELLGEINRLKSENRKLTDLLAIVMSKNLSELKHRQSEEEENSRKRKRDDENRENISSSNVIRSNISRVYVRIDPSDDSMVVRDGYQWRKYGQKVTRDNPSPRAYYKCSFALACPVKKKVQRSVDDPTLLVATYEGEHHHHSHNHHQCHSAPADSPTASPPGLGSSSTPRSDDRGKIQGEVTHNESDEMQQFLVEKMASSLTRNRGFTTALAAAITGRIFNEVFSSDNCVSDDVNISNSRGFPT